MSGAVEIVVGIAAVCYILARRMIGEPAEGKRLLVLPAVLTAVGLSKVSGDVHSAPSVLFLVVTAGLGVVLGVLRGLSVRLSDRDGLLFVRYTAWTVGLWAVNVAVKFGATALFQAAEGHSVAVAGDSLLLTLGTGMLAEGLVILARAVHTNQRVMWSQGKDGAPHTRSPFLDSLQDSRAARRR